MAQYLSPGVFVEEVPSTIKPIAGVSTSTAGFIGIVQDGPFEQPLAVIDMGTADGDANIFSLAPSPLDEQGADNTVVKVDGVVSSNLKPTFNGAANALIVTFPTKP